MLLAWVSSEMGVRYSPLFSVLFHQFCAGFSDFMRAGMSTMRTFLRGV